ncbi:MAG: HAMP domain-containing protein [Bdellovibrionaceae bacterium]|nr:HAMP domain-containing protein [Pseudobdellovibrionaceae bacterium]
MKWRFHISISVKLITVTIFLLAVTTVILARESANRFEEISIDREEQASRDQSRARSAEVEGLLLSYIDKAKVIASLLMKDTGSSEEKAKALDLTFGRDKDFVIVDVISRNADLAPLRVINAEYLQQYKLDKSFADKLRSTQLVNKIVNIETLFSGKEGHIEIRNSTIKDGAPLFTIGFPLAKDEYGIVTHIVLAEIRLDRLLKSFSSVSDRSLYLIDDQGRLLAHADEKKVLKNESMISIPIVKNALASELKQGQMRYSDSKTGESFTAAYTKTSLGVTTIAVASDAVILEAAHAMKREAFYIAGRILSVALFLVFIFSITLTTPIEKLVELTNKVAHGDFSAKANVKTRDEVGQLGEAFNHMLEGLLERDKVKSMFNKFHGSSVTEDLLKGDLQLGGSKKTVTVFFSDVRDFTKFSEGHSPEEVVSMLNEYFQIMVSIINKHGGIVDKFIGDAIMAVWGAPNSTERDTQNAVKACLEMRQALANLNRIREERGHVPIKIGIGLHRGEAISGTVGSSERMEYTVIGDTVNQASRIESSTKAFGTDFLMSDSLADHVKDEFIVEEAGRVEVKGKSEPLRLYKVRGYYDEAKNPIIVKTPFSDYDAEAADKVKMAN